MKKILTCVIVILITSGCSTQPLEKCVETTTLYKFSESMKYIPAEIKDLKYKKYENKLTNVAYEKKLDKLIDELPREKFWIEGSILQDTIYTGGSFEISGYKIKPRYSMPTISTQGYPTTIKFNFDDFNNLPDELQEGSDIEVLIRSWYGKANVIGYNVYYEIMAVKYNNQVYKSLSECN